MTQSEIIKQNYLNENFQENIHIALAQERAIIKLKENRGKPLWSLSDDFLDISVSTDPAIRPAVIELLGEIQFHKNSFSLTSDKQSV